MILFLYWVIYDIIVSKKISFIAGLLNDIRVGREEKSGPNLYFLLMGTFVIFDHRDIVSLLLSICVYVSDQQI